MLRLFQSWCTKSNSFCLDKIFWISWDIREVLYYLRAESRFDYLLSDLSTRYNNIVPRSRVDCDSLLCWFKSAPVSLSFISCITCNIISVSLKIKWKAKVLTIKLFFKRRNQMLSEREEVSKIIYNQMNIKLSTLTFDS